MQIKNETYHNLCLPEYKYPRVVVVGGGFAGISLVEELKDKAVQVVLIDKNNFHQFQPLLYQVATSALPPDSIVFPFRKHIKNYKNVWFKLAKVIKILPSSKKVLTDKGEISYDYLVIATGTRTNFFGKENIKQNALGLKTIRDALDIRHTMLLNMEKATNTCNKEEKNCLTNFAIVGGGPSGVEMAGALAEFKRYIFSNDFPDFDASLMKIYLVEASSGLLPTMSKKASGKSKIYLENMGVKVILNKRVVDYNGQTLLMDDGSFIKTGNLIWTAGVKGAFPEGLTKAKITQGDRLKTDSFGCLANYKFIFAIGDIADYDNVPGDYPQVAQVAMQQGKMVAKNILNIIQHKRMIPFKYKDKGSLATIGKHKAVADIKNKHFAGYFAWLLWSIVHLISISGFRNKTLVGINWFISYFNYEKSNRLIILNNKIKN